MKNFILIFMMVFFPAVYACDALGTNPGQPQTVEQQQEQLVLTYDTNLKEGVDVVLVPTEQLPKELVKMLPPDAKLVAAPLKDVVDPKQAFMLEETPTDPESIFHIAMGIGSAFIPGLAAWEGLGALLFKRKRQHYINAAKELNPMDEGYVDIKEAMKSVGAALGMAHSSPGTKAEFETEIATAEAESAGLKVK